MIVLLAAVGISQAQVDCKKFIAQEDRPVLFQVNRIPVDEIASDPAPLPKEHTWSTQQYRVGQLIYQGSGFAYRSEDNRFPVIRDAIINQSGTVCQVGVELPSGYDSATGKDIQTGQVTFGAGGGSPEGPSMAGAIGAQPVLPGYVLVASDPVYRARKQMLLALMKPAGKGLPATTLLVASGLAKGSMPAVVIARLRGEYQAISNLPNLHGTDIGVGVVGVDGNGTLKNVSFRLSREALDALMSQLGSPMQ